LTVLGVTTIAVSIIGFPAMPREYKRAEAKNYGISPTGLSPAYPEKYACSPLTSLYASWIDVDGTKREEIHSGVDGGRLGDEIFAPGPGVVRASWEADWGWGKEGAMLVRHSRSGLNLRGGPAYYYSAFYHMRIEDTRAFKEGDPISRGQVLGTVSRPGGKLRYLPEVHWEVYEVADDGALTWGLNERGAPFWTNASAKLVDPLHMLALHRPPDEDGMVLIEPFVSGRSYASFRGFTYILPCARK